MQRFRRSFFAQVPLALPTCPASFGLIVTASAQIPLSGVLQGQLGAGVYHASSITVPANAKLILAAGVILKFQLGTSFLVDGQLLTNGNGPSVGSRGASQGLHLRAIVTRRRQHWLKICGDSAAASRSRHAPLRGICAACAYTNAIPA